jgi:hypothetical protein
MTVCSHCGAEYTAGVNVACRECRLALEPTAAAALPPSDTGPDELLFELDSWPAEERVALGVQLTERDVPWRWEPGPVLVVREFDEAVVEDVLDDAEGGDEWEDVGGEEADEVAQAAMGDLFLAADGLVRSPGNGSLVEDVARLESIVTESDPPFGVDTAVWDEIGDLASGLVAAGEDADEEAVEQAAASLREFLRPYV